MKDELLNLIPDDILNLIWKKVKPSIKYSVNKRYFNKFYCFRFTIISNKFIYSNYANKYRFFVIKNLNYINHLIKNDCLMMIEMLINYKTKYDKTDYILNNKLIYENNKFKNFIDFIYYYSKYYNALKINAFIMHFIKFNKLTYLIKKEHKNNNANKINNKNNKWIY
tara:strand:+ start:315 stop:815 length:501 start_codon:yes stop_codon:yes gene_type:complete